jgi:hypothetical protein
MCVKILIAFLILLIVVSYQPYFSQEGFSNYYLGSTDGIYPSSQVDVLVQDT